MVVLLAMVCVAYAGERITNGGFGTPTGWHTWSTSGDPVTLNWDFNSTSAADNPTGGTGPALRLFTSAYTNKSFGVWQKVTLMQGQTYTIGGYSRLTDPGGNKCFADIWIVDENTMANADPIAGHHSSASPYQEAIFAAACGTVTKASESGWGGSGNFSNASIWDTPIFSPAATGVHRASTTYTASDSTGTNQTITGGTVDKWVVIRVNSQSAPIDVTFDSISLMGPDPCSGPPTITQQPISQTILSGGTATFTVAATSDGGDPTYQWRRGGSNIAGATSSSYTTGVAGAYDCVVTNGCGPATSQQATLTVLSPVVVSTIAAAKYYPSGTLVQLVGKVVSARTSYAYWIQDSDPLCGIRVNSTTYPVPGSTVSVTGYLATAASERRIDPVFETWGAAVDPPKPVFMLTKALGGAGLTEDIPGITNGAGANNIGLLARIYGTVTNVGAGYYYLDDGVGLTDGTNTDAEPNVGVRIVSQPGSLAKDDKVGATGIVSTFVNGSDVCPALIMPGCAMPNAGLAVGATSSTLCAGMSTSITVSSTEADCSYQLRTGSTNVGSPVSGNGSTISLSTGVLNTTTTFNVLAVRNVGGCSQQLIQTKTITVNPLPNANLAVSAQQTQIDVGQSTNVTVASSQTGVSYQLRKNADNSNVGSPVAGTGGTINLPTGALAAGAWTFNVLATHNSGGCSQQLAQTVTVQVGLVGSLSGKVMNALGQPLSGLVVKLSTGSFSTVTNSNGSYSFSNVPAGTYSLTANWKSSPGINTYQTHTWERVIVSADRTNPVAPIYLPHTWSKIGWHIQDLSPTGLSEQFLLPVHNGGKTCQMVKGMGNLGVSDTAAAYCSGSFCVGRLNDIDGVGGIQGFDEAWSAGVAPADMAWLVYYGTAKPTKGSGGLHQKMLQNPNIHVWELNNEWDAHYDWQADYTIAMMDLAEADGFRIAAFSAAAGTPSIDPNVKFSGDTRTELENLARVCARAKAHGGHMLALHEYAYDGTLQSEYTAHPGVLVGRYRLFHDYLKNWTATDDPANGWVGADCPIIITECVGDCSAATASVVRDLAWYDQNLVRQDSYVLGVATWNITSGQGECDLSRAYTALANYIVTDVAP